MLVVDYFDTIPNSIAIYFWIYWFHFVNYRNFERTMKECKIEIKDSSFFKDLLFCTCRYCIGRHTAASIGLANDIAKNAFEYLDFHDRRFLAHDIRKQINDFMNHKSNINICDYRSHITMDALTRIVECIEEAGLGYQGEGFQIDNHFFVVNQEHVAFEPYKNSISASYGYTFIMCYNDLLPWIKLANALDDESQYMVEYEFNGEVKTERCFLLPIVSSDLTNISIKYMPLKTYLDRSHVDSWIQEELINNVNPVNLTTS